MVISLPYGLEKKGVVGMNLFNFEDEEFSERKYVLTSPRSLQACDALGVKVCC